MSIIPQLEDALLEWSRVFLQRSTQEFNQWMNNKDISRSQIGVLMHLHFHGKCPISGVGKHLDISTPAASTLVDRLVQNGLVSRTDDVHDRRVKLVELSSEGQALLDEGFQARIAWMQNIGDFLSEQEQDRIASVINALVDAASKASKVT